MTRSPTITTSAAVGALSAALLSFAWGDRPWIASLDREVSDAAVRAAARTPAGTARVRIVLVAPDMDRGALRDLLDEVARRKPSAVVLDRRIDAQKGMVKTLRAARTALAAFPEATGGAEFPEELTVPLFGPTERLRLAPAIRSIPDAFVRAAIGMGIGELPPDPDGVVRRAPLVYRTQSRDRGAPGLALAGLIAAFRDKALQLGDGGRKLVAFASTDVPLDPQGTLLLRLRGPSGALATIRYGTPVEESSDPLASIEPGDFVVLGTADETVPTATDPNTPRAEVFATAIDNLLRGDPLRAAHPGLLVLHAAFAGALAAAALGLRGRRRVSRVLLVAALATILPALLLVHAGIVFPTSSTLGAALFGAVVAGAGRHRLANQDAPA